MADVPVRKEHSSERGVTRRGAIPRFGVSSPWDFFSMSPWSMMRRFNDEMDRWLAGREGGETWMWSPNIEVRQRDKDMVISADLPGLTKDDVKVEMTEEGLCIRGERKKEHEERGEGYYRTERSYGTFGRVIPLPEGASIDQARASFKDGVLEVTVPVPEGVRRHREIPIEAPPKTRTSGEGS